MRVNSVFLRGCAYPRFGRLAFHERRRRQSAPYRTRLFFYDINVSVVVHGTAGLPHFFLFFPATVVLSSVNWFGCRDEEYDFLHVTRLVKPPLGCKQVHVEDYRMHSLFRSKARFRFGHAFWVHVEPNEVSRYGIAWV